MRISHSADSQVVRGMCSMSPCKDARALCCVCVLWGKVCVGVVVFFIQETFLAFRHNFDHFAFQDVGTEKQIIT